jgi:hypothetical protein
MDSESAPRAWIGQRVSIEMRDAAPAGFEVGTGHGVFDKYYGTLHTVNEFGVEVEGGIFYPWNAVRRIALTTTT